MTRRRIALLGVTPLVLIACVAIYLVAGPPRISAHAGRRLVALLACAHSARRATSNREVRSRPRCGEHEASDRPSAPQGERRMMRIGTRTSLALLLAVLSFSCSRANDAASGASPTAATSAEATASARPQSNEEKGAREEFTLRCASCHDAQGTGDGPYVDELSTAPPSFRDPKWQGSVTDEEIENAIQHGGASVGKSSAMPGFPDFIGNPGRVVAMREYVRSFGR